MNNEENEERVILLKDEHGEEHEFHVIDFLTEDENKYVILQPSIADDDDIDENELVDEEAEEAEEGYEAVIMRVEEQEGEHILVLVEDDEEWDKVAKAFEEKHQA